jgi:glycosyltransferase involved in cell wall biosynthesis
MKHLFILTTRYPFAPGEEFFEEEVLLWARQSNFIIHLVPLQRTKVVRSYPKGLILDLTIANKNTKWRKIAYVIPAILSKEFWIDIVYLKRERKLGSKNLIRLIRSMASFCLFLPLLKNIARTAGSQATVYSYWNAEMSYAAAKLKHQKKFSEIVTRLHGFDIYEERYPGGYIPLKRQFMGFYDHIMLLSEEAKTYVELRYGANSSQTSVERLGVEVPPAVCPIPSKAHFHIISVSFCVPVKGIDKIVHALSAFADACPELRVSWTHIGNGPLLEEIQNLAEKELDRKVDFDFAGYKENSEVKRIYQEQSFDVFINCSRSEGVPVSIMEAMSAGIPAIAPNVGGIKELLGDTGYLMSSSPDILEVRNALIEIEKISKVYETRIKARARISTLYNARQNYTALITSISKTSSMGQDQ